jgi:hypothetical protein
MFKLKSPSRLARETFLIALGIAKYEGNIANLDKYSVLFPDLHHFSPMAKKLPAIDLTRIDEGKTKKLNESVEHQPPSIADLDKGTPVNSKMIAIESELEQDMAQLRDRLEAKNKIVSELHHELTHLHSDYNASKEERDEYKKNLRLSERRIQ